ncbi:MAG: hypothetical protein A4E32_01492 [Methanomassiliicoccales archaeon PtaU1.Bin124]|nr:MAG: hypothetical protein A4E32_01492 [Methanomassiliicoccales archaeon PtaU1.Bin124]
MRRKTVVIMASLIIIAAFASFVMLQPAKGADRGTDPADIKIVKGTGVKTILGDAKITLKVTNAGDLAGTKTYNCMVNLGGSTCSQSVTVELNGGETKTYTVDIDLPFEAITYDWTWDVSPRQ